MDFQALRTELLTDPLALGYSTQTDTQAAATLNSLTTGRTVNRTGVPTDEVLGAIQAADWPTTATLQNQLECILVGSSASGVNAANTNIRAMFSTIFAGKTTTLNALNALGTMTVSRATEIGLGTITVHDVTVARSGVW